MALHLNKHDFPSPKDALCQVCLKLALCTWFLRRDCSSSSVYFAISLLSPQGKKRGPSFEQPSIPFTQACFVPSLEASTQWLLRTRFLKFVNVFSLFRYYLSLENNMSLHLNKLESPSPMDALCQVLLKIAQWFLRRWKCETFTNTQTMDGGNRWSKKLTWSFSLGELKKVVSLPS